MGEGSSGIASGYGLEINDGGEHRYIGYGAASAALSPV